MTASASLLLYRDLVPAHVGVPDSVVETFLTVAALAHTPAAWGVLFATAMVWHAAANIEPDVVAGMYPVPSTDGEEICAPVRPPVDAEGKPIPVPFPGETRYWQRYLAIRTSRAATAPRLVRASWCG